MKSKSLALFILVGTLASIQAGSSSQKLDFEKAVLLEEASGKLEEAITLFKKVAESASDVPLAAQAQLRVGMCYEKLGKQEARKAYQVVLDKFSSQQEAVRLARERLAWLDRGRASGRSMIVLEFLRSGKFTFDKVSDPSIDVAFSVSRDGQTFVYVDWMTGDLAMKNFASDKMRRIYGVDWYKSTEFFLGPILSPDEKRMAYVHYAYPERQFFTRLSLDSLQGDARSVLYEAPNAAGIYPHDWHPDGSSVLGSLETPDRSISLVSIGIADKKIQRLVTLDWQYPIRAQYSPDGKFIAYDSTKNGDRKIYLMTADGGQERVLVDSPAEDDSPLWTRDGRFLLFRSNRSGEWDLWALAMKEGASGEAVLIKSNIGEATFLRGITDDGRLFYGEVVAGQEVAVLDRNNKSGIAGVRILPKLNTRASRHGTFSPDSRRLVYVNGGYGALERQGLRLTTLEGKIVKDFLLDPDFVRNFRPRFSPDGSRIALVIEDRKRKRKAVVFSAETGTVLKAIPLEGLAAMFVGWSGDGRTLYVRAGPPDNKEDRLHAIDIETERVTTQILGKGNVAQAAISPDGKQLIFILFGQPESTWMLLSLPDGEQRMLKQGDASNIVWDSDSEHIFYKKGKDTKRIYRYSVGSGREELFLDDCESFALTDVSPDGQYLAFNRAGNDNRIWVVENFLPKEKSELTAQ